MFVLNPSPRMGKDDKPPKKRLVLDALDQERSIDVEKYWETLKDYHLRLLILQRALKDTKHNVIIVVEGPDAGKGRRNQARGRETGSQGVPRLRHDQANPGG